MKELRRQHDQRQQQQQQQQLRGGSGPGGGGGGAQARLERARVAQQHVSVVFLGVVSGPKKRHR